MQQVPEEKMEFTHQTPISVTARGSWSPTRKTTLSVGAGPEPFSNVTFAPSTKSVPVIVMSAVVPRGIESGSIFVMRMPSLGAFTVNDVELIGAGASPLDASILVGEELQYIAIGQYDDDSSQVITDAVAWSSSNEGLVSINSTGLATGKAAGVLDITATSTRDWMWTRRSR